MEKNDYKEFQKLIHYDFKDINHLETAFTHTSYVNELRLKRESYERYEFLGDAILEFLKVYVVTLKEILKEEIHGSLVRRGFVEAFGGLGIAYVILTDDKEVVPVEIKEHLGRIRLQVLNVVPVKGHDAEGIKAFKGLDLTLFDVGDHGGFHLLYVIFYF